MEFSGLHERLHAATGDQSFRRIGELTETHPETVRRYMSGQAPSVEFLAAVCAKLRISADWLLTGRGPMRSDDTRAHALREANATELLHAMARAIERLIERVDRLERYMQSLETHVRATSKPASEVQAAGDVPTPHVSPGDAHVQAAADPQHRARALGSTLAERPRPDAR